MLLLGNPVMALRSIAFDAISAIRPKSRVGRRSRESRPGVHMIRRRNGGGQCEGMRSASGIGQECSDVNGGSDVECSWSPPTHLYRHTRLYDSDAR